MMKLWLQSYAKHTSLTPSAALSVVVHAVLIGLAVVETAAPDTEMRELPPNSIARFLAPPDREAGQQAQREMIRYVAIAVPPSGLGGAAAAAVKEFDPSPRLSGPDLHDALPLPEFNGADSVFSVVDVDSAATRYEWSAAPVYPPKMLEQKVEGLVRAEFIVSQEGYADTNTLRIIETTAADFTKAVRDALPFMRFKPAKIGNSIVSQLVLQEFRFQITIPVDTTRTKKPIP
ncbi:MAG TPA: energy transducer TonB [Gemmatimonadaceae bacterium]|nr:energy transducer TonB [Gemmatimonadaceae bacterium]